MLLPAKDPMHRVVVNRHHDRWTLTVMEPQPQGQREQIALYVVSKTAEPVLMLMRLWADCTHADVQSAYNSILNGVDPDMHRPS